MTFFNKITIIIYYFIIINNLVFAQETNYFDNLEVKLKSINEISQIETIVNIPYDKMISNFSRSLQLIKNGINLSIKNKEPEYEGRLQLKLAQILYYQGKYDKSVKHNLIAIKIFERISNNIYLGKAFVSIGYQMKRRNIEKAFEYMRKGITILENISQPALSNKKHEALVASYNNYGVLLQMKSINDSALFYYFKGYKMVTLLKDSIGLPYSLNNIASVYQEAGDYDNAKKYYDKAFKIRLLRNDITGIIENYSFYGDLYFDQKKYNKAKKYYLFALENAKSIKYKYICQTICKQLALCYENIGDFKNALIYQKLQELFKDSLLNEKTSKAISQLEVKYETQQKERLIKIQKAKIKQEKFKIEIRNYSLLALFIILLLIITLAIYVYKQQKYKQQKLIEENLLKDKLAKLTLKNKLHEDRSRISRELHDNIGSKLTYIISTIDNMGYLINKVNKKFNNKLFKLADFSHKTMAELRNTIWAIDKNEITSIEFKTKIGELINEAREFNNDINYNLIFSSKCNNVFSSIQCLNLYRIIQEAINNANKYSCASYIEINFCKLDNKVEIKITDNGIGFDINKIKIGNGMANMKTRALLIHAKLNIISQPNMGTKISIIL